MKKLFLKTCIALSFIFVLSGCSGEKKTVNTPSSTPQTTISEKDTANSTVTDSEKSNPTTEAADSGKSKPTTESTVSEKTKATSEAKAPVKKKTSSKEAVLAQKKTSSKSTKKSKSSSSSKNSSSSKTSTASNSLQYNNKKLGISLTFPKTWKGKYTIKENKDGISVYFKPKTPDNNIGLLFALKDKSSKDFPEGMFDTVCNKRYFKSKGVTYVIGGPTDVNFSEDHPEFNDFIKLRSDIPKVISTLK